MQRLLAIAWLTWKAAFRFRLFLVLAVLLLASVVGLPLLVQDDGTARGFTQILLTYTLSAITGLLGLSTLWLACGTLARDIDDCQMQVLATKPVARWQIWLGKWLGIMALNAVLLALAGGGVFGLLQWRAARLPTAVQQELRSEVLVARGSVGQKNNDAAIEAETDRELRERLKTTTVDSKLDLIEVRRQIHEQVAGELQLVPPGTGRQWRIDLGHPKSYFHNRPMQLRIKFNSANGTPSGTFTGWWQVGSPNSTNYWQSEPMSLAPDTFHEFAIPPNLCDDQGRLTILFMNENDTSLLFPLDEGIHVLYPEGGFAPNFARGLGIIFCWLALLTALGLMSASFLSFPVAAFFSLGLLLVGLSSGTLAEAVGSGSVAAGNEETGVAGHSAMDMFLIPAFKGGLAVIALAVHFSPIDDLSTGQSISWGELGAAVGEIVLLLGGAIALAGIFLFNRRELATAQGTQ
jgi:hypothetical protein